MIFRKVTATKYIGTDGYSLQQLRDGSFSILKGDTVTRWGTGFQTVRAAETFISQHDYINANCDFLPILEGDADFIYKTYAISGQPEFGNKWYITDDFWVQGGQSSFADSSLRLRHFDCSDGSCYHDIDSLISKLDEVICECGHHCKCAIASIVFRDINFRKQPITAALKPKDLIRVKSSNVWAYGVEIGNSNPKLGDVYVQFKGKNGGAGDVYRYYDVPVSLWRRIVGHPSKGHAVWKYLRNNFQYSKLTGDKKGKLPNAVN